MSILNELLNAKCQTIGPKDKGLIIPSIESNLSELEGWTTPLNYAHIEKTFQFKNYYQTIHFVNAVTWLAQKEDHHPQICFNYNQATVHLTTDSIRALSLNDMIMAAKINQLLQE